jgi:hypothetical protein
MRAICCIVCSQLILFGCFNILNSTLPKSNDVAAVRHINFGGSHVSNRFSVHAKTRSGTASIVSHNELVALVLPPLPSPSAPATTNDAADDAAAADDADDDDDDDDDVDAPTSSPPSPPDARIITHLPRPRATSSL